MAPPHLAALWLHTLAGSGSTFPYGSPAVIYKHKQSRHKNTGSFPGIGNEDESLCLSLTPQRASIETSEPPEITEKLSWLGENLFAFLSS